MLLRAGIFFLLCLLSCTIFAQNVGIGTSQPRQKLDVDGAIKLGFTENALPGSLRWNAGRQDFEGYNGVAWVSLTGGRAGWGNQETYTTESEAGNVGLNKGINAEQGGQQLGAALALQEDVLAAGAPGDNVLAGTHASSGTVRLFRKEAGGWVYRTQVFNPTPAANENFGFSVALSGNTFVAGTPGARVNADAGSNWGMAYVYNVANGTNLTATLQASLVAPDGAPNDGFGHVVAINDEWIAVSAPFVDENTGSVYLYHLHQGNWIYHSRLSSPNITSGEGFGLSLSLYGNLLAVGASQAGADGYSQSGFVYLYELAANGNVWNHKQTLAPAARRNFERFGHSVYLSGDTLLAGAVENGGNTGDGTGRVDIYIRNGNKWEFAQSLRPQEGQAKQAFGYSVYLHDGNLLVGSPMARVGGHNEQGKSYLFRRQGNTWTEQVVFTSSDGKPGDNFGAAVIISADHAVAGAPLAPLEGFSNDNGRVYFFRKN